MPRVLCVARGQGYGHASRMHALMAAMRKQMPSLEVIFASGGTGSTYFSHAGINHHRFTWGDEDDHDWLSRREVARFLKRVRPELDAVIADELFYVPDVAAQVGLKTFFFACNLKSRHSSQMRRSAGTPLVKLYVPDWRELHRDAPDGRVCYVGPIVSRPTNGRTDVTASSGTFDGRVLVVLGSAHSKKRTVQEHMLRDAAAYAEKYGSQGVHVDIYGPSDLVGKKHGVSGLSVRGFQRDVVSQMRQACLVFACGGASGNEAVASGTPAVLYAPDTHVFDRARSLFLISEGYALNPDDILTEKAAPALLPGSVRPAGELAWCDLDKLASRILEAVAT